MTTTLKRSRPVRVADRIKDWVVERDLRKGDKLPNEAEMIALFGVSKGTVREALRILEAQGLIMTKTGPGGGSIVDQVSPSRAQSLLGNYFYFQGLSLADIYQMRRLLEPELAAGLAGRLSEAQLARLAELVRRHDRPARSPEEERQEHIASLAFHKQLADYADNRLLGFVIGFMAQMLTEMTVYHRLYDPPNLELWRRGRMHQLDLVSALRAGEAERARHIMRAHMQDAEKLMQAQAAELGRKFLSD